MIRLLSWNVRSLRDDTAALTSLVRSLQPDLFCVQEAPRFLRWRAKCAALARDCGLLHVAGGRSAGAVMLATSLRVDVEAVDERLLPKAPGLHQRGVALASVRVGEAALTVATTHLGLDAGERLRHASELLGALPADRPVVLAGDVNEGPGAPAWDLIADGVGPAADTGPTFPARRPRRRIDAVFVGTGLSVVSARVVDAPEVLVASDHRPVLVDLAGA